MTWYHLGLETEFEGELEVEELVERPKGALAR